MELDHKKHTIVVLLLLSLISFFSIGQNGYNKYRVTFSDKNNSPYSLDNPELFLSAKAIERRQRQNIPITSEDLPVNAWYIDSVLSKGFRLHCINKWFNSIVVEAIDTVSIAPILALPFVVSVDTVFKYKASFERQQYFEEKFKNNQTSSYNYGNASTQLTMLGIDVLHNNHHTGQGITIALMDAGYKNIPSISGFSHLFSRNAILSTWDFVDREPSVYEDHPHGTAVLSIIAAQEPSVMMGGAPDANFHLFRTEDVYSESLVEEDNWVAAAERADSLGADIIQTSLGYFTFDHANTSHTYADMNGTTTRISQGANKAASRGMLVVISAGNEGNSPWYYITAPADADSVLAVGAVNANQQIAEFSSRGPSSDGQIKPDLCAMGAGTYVYDSYGQALPGNGTSFASPLISAAAACLWSAFPNKTAWQIREMILSSCHLFDNPNNQYGYGIPNLATAYFKEKGFSFPYDNDYCYLPSGNLSADECKVFFYSSSYQQVCLYLYEMSGKIIYEICDYFNPYEFKNFTLPLPSKGMYFLRIKSENLTRTEKLIRY